MKLFINTSGQEAEVGIFMSDHNLHDKITWPAAQNQSEELLSRIELLLSRNNLVKQNLTGISVVVGPGSYTGVRVGIAIANALALALKIPVTGFRIDEKGGLTAVSNSGSAENFVLPEYQRPPHITQPKGIDKISPGE